MKKNAIKLAHNGAFQCDGGSTIGASLLRDHFNIPARLIGGYKGTTDIKDLSISHVLSSSQGPDHHANVEVADPQGNWWRIDFTPAEKDDKDSEGPAYDDDYRDNKDPTVQDDILNDEEGSGKGNEQGENQEGENQEGEGQEGQGEGGEKGEGAGAGSGDLKEGQQAEEGVARQGKGTAQKGPQSRNKEKHRGRGLSPGEKPEKGSSSLRGQTQKDEVRIEDLIQEVRQHMKKSQEEEEASKKAKPPKGSKGKPAQKNNKKGKTSESKEGFTPIPLPKTKSDDYLSQIETRNPFVSRLLNRLLAWALNAEMPNQAIQDRLTLLKRAVGSDADGNVMQFEPFSQILAEARILFVGTHSPLAEWAQKIVETSENRSVSDLMDQLHDIRKRLEFTLRHLDDSERMIYDPLLIAVQEAMNKVYQLKHKDAEKVRVAQELYDKLPGKISRKVLKDQFGFPTPIGADPASLKFANAIGKGELNNYRLMSVLAPYTEFIVEPIYKPRFRRILTQEQAFRRRRKAPRQIVNTRHPNQMRFALPVEPHLTKQQALTQGKLFVLSQKRSVVIPQGNSEKDPEKCTILVYDTSGSMAGQDQELTSNYMASFVDKALSDQAKHKVFIIGFDTAVHTREEITNPQQAIDFIKKYEDSTANTAGGTEFQDALKEAAEMIKKANHSGDKSLARANIVLISDGGAPMQVSWLRGLLKSARKRGDGQGETDLLFAYVAIGGTNEDLREVAESQKKKERGPSNKDEKEKPKKSKQNLVALTESNIGTDRNHYIEFDGYLVSRLMEMSRAKAEPENDFWTDKKMADLELQEQSAISSALDNLFGVAMKFEGELPGLGTTSTAGIGRMKTALGDQQVGEQEKRKGTLRGQLEGFRRALKYVGPYLDRGLRHQTMEGILEKWKQMLPISIKQLDLHEITILNFIFNEWLETGSPEEE